MKPVSLLFLFLAVGALANSAEDYAFTYDNPMVGSVEAQYRLEYFSSTTCASCLTFERAHLGDLSPLIEGATLRVVFRDLPNGDVNSDLAVTQFCLQEFPDYLVRRVAFKANPDHVRSLPSLRGLAAERHNECLDSPFVQSITSHNFDDFERAGFRGTPSFILTDVRTQFSVRWSGATTSDQVRRGLKILIQQGEDDGI